LSESTVSENVRVWDDGDSNEYVIEYDGERAGKAEYRDIDGRRVFTHTEIDDRFSGDGLGSKLVRFALDDMRNSETSIVPLCPFFAAYIKRHQEYSDLVDHEMTMKLKKRR
jgi:predicted GNAT family acetyltransferase